MESTDVLVVGAGPTGLLLAGDLAEAGVAVTVLDRRADGESNLTRAFVVTPRTLEELDARGLADELAATGSTITEMRLYRKLWVDVSVLPTRFPYFLLTPQFRTEAALRERAERAGARIVWSSEVTKVSQSETGVEVVTGASSGQPGRWRARYLVGADGAHSTIRRALGEPFPGEQIVQSMMLADVRFAEPARSAMRSDAGPGGFAFHVPFGDGWHRVIAWNRDDQRPPGAALELDEIKAMARRVFGTDYGMHSPRWLSRIESDERQVARYRIGRAFLMGDAAHVHTPAGGQGMNTGLQDAANLSWRLAAAVHGYGATDDVLDGYQRERHPVGSQVLKNSGGLMRIAMTGSAPRRALRALRLGGVSDRLRLPARIAARMTGLDIHYPAPADAHPSVGHRVPDLQLAGGARLYEALRGGRFVFVPGRSATRHQPWPGPVTAVRATRPPRHSLLIRPDGYLAWAS
ncbi:FAD-dependent monooxygenase [Kribbella sp. DT2]|uniref:FAD-dependent monooxygenase n=1 Tax=Kribbella sp. DT2 TaxID=3393427 RepID=UPI003CF82F40